MSDTQGPNQATQYHPVAWRYRLEGWGEQYWHYFTKEPRFREEGEIWQPLYLHPPALTPAEIEELKREIEHLTKSGIIEVAVRNPSVAEYMEHWENRAIAAEHKLAMARVDALKEAARCIEEGFNRGIPTKMDQCAHGKFGWEDCDSCAVVAIRALKSGGANG